MQTESQLLESPRRAAPQKAAAVARALLPLRCLLCDSAARLAVCQACAEDFPPPRSPCALCGAPASGEVCGGCLKSPPPFTAAAAFLYAPGVSHLVARLKYEGAFQTAQTLAVLSAPALRRARDKFRPDIVTPIPLHFSRLKERGFNQSALLLRALAGEISLRTDESVLRRIRNTRPQVEMTGAAGRRRNIKGAFAAGNVKGKRVAILDDVITTGATVEEAARTLKKAGAAAVAAWCVAQAQLT